MLSTSVPSGERLRESKCPALMRRGFARPVDVKAIRDPSAAAIFALPPEAHRRRRRRVGGGEARAIRSTRRGCMSPERATGRGFLLILKDEKQERPRARLCSTRACRPTLGCWIASLRHDGGSLLRAFVRHSALKHRVQEVGCLTREVIYFLLRPSTVRSSHPTSRATLYAHRVGLAEGRSSTPIDRQHDDIIQGLRRLRMR